MNIKQPLIPRGVIATIGLFASMLAINVAMVLVIGVLFKWLWNTALPPLISVPRITYGQASALLGLILLVRVVIQGVKLKLNFRV